MGPARTGSPEAVLTVAGRDIRLTATEFDLLRVRSAVGGRIVTTEVLVRHSVENRGSGDTDRLRTALKKLPRKARRRRGQSHLHLQRKRLRLPLRAALRDGRTDRCGSQTDRQYVPRWFSRLVIAVRAREAQPRGCPLKDTG